MTGACLDTILSVVVVAPASGLTDGEEAGSCVGGMARGAILIGLCLALLGARTLRGLLFGPDERDRRLAPGWGALALVPGGGGWALCAGDGEDGDMEAIVWSNFSP